MLKLYETVFIEIYLSGYLSYRMNNDTYVAQEGSRTAKSFSSQVYDLLARGAGWYTRFNSPVACGK